MTDAQFTQLCLGMKQTIQERTPYKTGNLCDTATRGESRGNDSFEIFVDEKIAPYFKFVNNNVSVWRKSAGVWQAYKNRNYHYFEKAFHIALDKLINQTGGSWTRD